MDSEWVIMLYLDGDNKLSAALQQHLQIAQSVGSTDSVQLVVLIDGNGDADTKLYYVLENTLEEQDWPEESDMSDPQTLIDFTGKVMTDYPSKHYGLTIASNKGSGWQGVCWDDHGDGIMITMPELLSALQTITNNGSNKLGLLLIETCLGGNFAFRYQVRSCCEYTVGYADCGLIGDIPYEESLSQLIQNPSMTPQELAKVFVDNFEPQDIPFYKIKQAMGATTSAQLDDVASALNSLALYFINHVDTHKENIQSALERTRKYGIGFDIDYYVDISHFLTLFESENPEFLSLKDTLLDSINQAVIALAQLEDDHSCGFNIYFPARKGDYNDALRYETSLPSLYEETLFAMDTNWDEFLKIYLGVTNNMPPSTPLINGPTRGKIGESYDYTFVSHDPEGDDIYYWVQWGEGCPAIQWLGPYASGQEITFNNTWQSQGEYIVSAKAKDILDNESDWGTLEVTMPKKQYLPPPTSMVFLMGRITDIETNPDGDFRFLPQTLLDIWYDINTGVTVSLHDETYGGFPCCGFIDKNNFHGLLTSTYIIGLWIIT